MSAAALGLSVGAEVGAARFRRLEREVVLESAKWDPQVGDVPVLAPYPLRLSRRAWRGLAAAVEALAAEAMAAETALLASSRALGALGLPAAVRRRLVATRSAPVPALARVLRFDVHPTEEGWRVSEVNADVPGGYAEASGFTRAMAAEGGGTPTGDPVAALVDAAVARLDRPGIVALVHATAYADDRQVADLLARSLAARGIEALPVAPDHLAWKGGRARLSLAGRTSEVAGLWRFFPAEWLPGLPRASGWGAYLGGSEVPACNPGHAVLLQSKRWTLAAEALGVRLPTWRALHAEVAPPTLARRADPGWVLKPVLGRVGEGVGIAGVTGERALRSIRRAAAWWPGSWVAQRRFVSAPVEGPEGPVHACLGVYVVDGRTAGIYGRIARRPLIDGRARDVAVLLDDEEGLT